MRFYLVVAACVLTLAGCSKSEPIAEKVKELKSTEAAKQYDLHGEVLRVDPHGQIATIKHEAIGDWMGAMTMDFPVKDEADFAKLKPVRP
ncbi:MAG: copper-binding protein [Acidobacteriota bacterium]